MTERIRLTGPTLGSPEWMADFGSRESLIPGGAKLDVAQFIGTDGVLVTASGPAATGATAIPVAALSGALPVGAVLFFTGGTRAVLTAAAAAAATSITVSPLPRLANIANGDTAIYAGFSLKFVPSGTVIGRTLAERNAGTGYGLAAAADDEIYILAFDVTDASIDNDAVLYRHGRVVKENFLPGFAGLAGGLVTVLRTLYQMQRGAE